MICTKQPALLDRKPIKITNIWEVRLDAAIWRKIQAAAHLRKVTASWIVRFCLFRLCDERLTGKKEIPKGNKFWCSDISTSHRHRLCLYGEDEKFVRQMACENRMTVSAFIRFALFCFLDDILSQKVNDQHLFEFGIKLNRIGEFITTRLFSRPLKTSYDWRRFFPDQWWRRLSLNHHLYFIDDALQI